MRDNGVIVGTGATSEEVWIISRMNEIGSPRNKRIDARNHNRETEKDRGAFGN